MVVVRNMFELHGKSVSSFIVVDTQILLTQLGYFDDRQVCFSEQDWFLFHFMLLSVLWAIVVS